jgi:hypothetical protein
MSLEFIPNQPIIFETPIGDYPCLNNDPKHYGQLAQEDDTLCVQWKLGPCGPSPLCEPNMVMETPGANELGAWTAGTGWSSSGFANLSFDGAGGDGQADQDITGLVAGTTYQLRLNISTFTGNFDLEVIWSLADTRTITQAGDYLLYFTANDDPLDLTFNTSGATTSGDTIVIENIQLIQWTDCWQDELPDDLPTWSYSFDAGQGKFCSTDTTQGDLINTTAFSTANNYHGVTLVISNATQGALEVRLGGVLLGTTSGNGEQGFYGIPTAGTDLVLTKTGDFDGCVSQVNVEDYGDPSNATVRFITDDGNTYSNYEIPDLIEDRLIWCSPEYDNLTWTVDTVPDSVLQCALLRVEVADPCDGTLYLSTNYINFKKTGWDCTKLVESWNDGYAFGFYFGDIASPDFKLTQRLRVLAFNPVYRNAGEEYLYSSGNTGRSYAQSQKARTAWFDYMDEYAHDCTRTQLLGQKLFIEGYAFYYPTEDYEPEWNENGRYNLAQSRVTVFHEEAIFGSACGVMANTICPPQIVPSPVETYTQLQLKGEWTNGGFDFTNCAIVVGAFDETGTIIPSIACSSGPYDLTVAGDRITCANDIICALDDVFGTSCTGTVSLAISTLTVDISGAYTGANPSPVLSVAFYDTLANYPAPIGTIPS